MFFDTKAALARLRSEGQGDAIRAPCATSGESDSTKSTNSTRRPAQPENRAPAPSSTKSTNSTDAGPETPSDPDLLLAHLRACGPTSYGGAAISLGIGASRAWRAEAALVAAGLVRLDHLGRMTLIEEARQ